MAKTTVYWRKRYKCQDAGPSSALTRPLIEKTQNFPMSTDGLAALAELHGTRTYERYEIVMQNVTPITPEQVKRMVADGDKLSQKAEEKAQRATDEKEYARLRQKLGIED